MSYSNVFIKVSEDCPASQGEIPTAKRDAVPAHVIQYELLTEHPYQFGHEDLVYAVYVRQKGIPEAVLATDADAIRAELFSKGHPCLRASSLTKRYGFGAHYNEAGKIALYPVESPEYQAFMQNDAVRKLPAMRNKK
ncbi:MAG TPA: DUF6157 family protein [Cytophagales bacterium]|jgi:hypothetical protein